MVLGVVTIVAAALLMPAVPGAADGNEAPGAPLAYRTLSSGPHTCVVRGNGSVVCWGYNLQGQLGLGDAAHRGDDPGEMGENLQAVDLGTGRTAIEVAAGNNHTCALLDNGSVKCWGYNLYGQLGLGDTAFRGDDPGEMGDNLPAVPLGTGRTATAIVASIAHTCALLDDGSVKCWGYNGDGGLGQGHANDLGDQPGEMGDALPPVSLGAGRTATAISSGGTFTCALLDNATVKCWGYNSEGQLGLGDTDHRGDNAGEMGDDLPTVDLGTGRTATVVTSSRYHTCALLDDDSVKCWGFNLQGELGQGDTAHRGDGPGEMGDNLAPVDLGTGRTAVALTGGELHTCAVLDNATVKCWGYNDFGQLGQGDTNWRGDEANEMGDNLAPVDLGTGRTPTAVTAGAHTTCARLDNGELKCWGTNAQGQLGQGDTTSRGDDPGEMGDALPAVDVPLPPTGVSGTVTESGSGDPLAGAWVAVLRTSDFSIAAGVVADGSGNFEAPVAAGSYYLYVVDPSGAHTAGFHGAPATVTVTAGNTTDVDPQMVSLRGAVAGTVTEAGSGTPIGGAWVIGINATTGATQRGAVANGAGQYNIAGLAAGSYRPVFVDPTGAHASRYFPNSVDFLGATSLAVTAGASTAANVALPAQSTTPGPATLSGTVREAGTNATLAGVFVVALRASDFRNAGGAVTNGSGLYSLNVAAGDYKLAFIDSTGLHNMEWHDNQPNTGLATATSVTAPAVTDAALDANTGSMAGTITDDPSGNPLVGAWVVAIGPTGAIAGGAVTSGAGTYTIAGLPPGTYRATIVDPNGGRRQEYHNNSPDYAGSTPITVTAAGTATINAALAFAPPANDTFANAQVVTGASGTTTGSTVHAAKEPGEPNHGGNAGGGSIWYRWTAPSAGTATFTTCGSGFDTLLGAYTGTAVNSLTALAGNDDSCGIQSSVSFAVTAGVTYRVAVDGYDNARGAVTLNWSLA